MALELTNVAVGTASLERYREVIADDQWRQVAGTLPEVTARLRDRVVWNVNSTTRGGGVAELLAAMIPYERGAEIDTRWVVIEGSDPFFKVTKRLHLLLHGDASDDSRLTEEDCRQYEETLESNARALLQMVSPRDVVILHDPQTVGLAPALARHGCRVIWRCHIGVDEPNEAARRAWDFLRAYVSAAEACVFSRRAYAWEGLDPDRLAFIAPAIDAFTPKNQELDGETTRAILARCGVLEGGDGKAASFLRGDGSIGRVTMEVEKFEESSPPEDGPLVVQVSRWDPLKDPIGVMKAFAEHVAPNAPGDLVLAGPRDHAVKDDPGQAAVASEVEDRWRELAPDVRARVHLVHIPLEDEEQNAAIVNALQRHATVVVQKSLAEGFGLTVAEAMWKARPVVASRVGGIGDQVEHGRSGVLVDDPQDLRSFGAAVVELLEDGARIERMGEAARRRVTERFLVPRQLLEQWRLIDRLLG